MGGWVSVLPPPPLPGPPTALPVGEGGEGESSCLWGWAEGQRWYRQAELHPPPSGWPRASVTPAFSPRSPGFL